MSSESMQCSSEELVLVFLAFWLGPDMTGR